MKYLILNLLLMSHQVSAQLEIIEFSEEIAHNLVPAHTFHHFGFRLPDADKINLSDFGNPDKLYPMYPLYKSKFGGKKFIGVKIPQEYANSSFATSAYKCLFDPLWKVT